MQLCCRWDRRELPADQLVCWTRRPLGARGVIQRVGVGNGSQRLRVLVTPAKPPLAQLAVRTSEHNDLAISLITRLYILLMGYEYHCLFIDMYHRAGAAIITHREGIMLILIKVNCRCFGWLQWNLGCQSRTPRKKYRLITEIIQNV